MWIFVAFCLFLPLVACFYRTPESIYSDLIDTHRCMQECLISRFLEISKTGKMVNVAHDLFLESPLKILAVVSSAATAANMRCFAFTVCQCGCVNADCSARHQSSHMKFSRCLFRFLFESIGTLVSAATHRQFADRSSAWSVPQPLYTSFSRFCWNKHLDSDFLS